MPSDSLGSACKKSMPKLWTLKNIKLDLKQDAV